MQFKEKKKINKTACIIRRIKLNLQTTRAYQQYRVLILIFSRLITAHCPTTNLLFYYYLHNYYSTLIFVAHVRIIRFCRSDYVKCTILQDLK